MVKRVNLDREVFKVGLAKIVKLAKQVHLDPKVTEDCLVHKALSVTRDCLVLRDPKAIREYLVIQEKTVCPVGMAKE